MPSSRAASDDPPRLTMRSSERPSAVAELEPLGVLARPVNEPTKYPEGSLQVDKDWGSTGLWVRQDSHWTKSDYAHYNILEWLVRRFDYWSAWYETYHPWQGEELHDSFEPYGLSLAIDLKLFFGEEYRVFFRGNEIQPVPFDPDNLPK